MTGHLFATGRGVPPTGRDLRPDTHALGRVDDVAHAVARPVVDGLESSVCGVLVVATAGVDWPSTQARRCEECARIAG
jgi:hypothetical protein